MAVSDRHVGLSGVDTPGHGCGHGEQVDARIVHEHHEETQRGWHDSITLTFRNPRFGPRLVRPATTSHMQE
jgi:hypothetical protein